MATAAEARTLQNFVGGSFVDATVEATLEDRDPATGELAARVPLSGPRTSTRRSRAARQAQPAWREVSPPERARDLLALRDVLVRHRDELAALVTADMGKTLADADGEVGRGIESVEVALRRSRTCSRARTLEGVAARHRRRDGSPAGRRGRRDHPVQLPGDDPALVPAVRDRLRQHLRAEALGAGPARHRSGSVELIAEVEIFPPGVVNLVHGGREAVNALLDHPEVDAVSFVGSGEHRAH